MLSLLLIHRKHLIGFGLFLLVFSGRMVWAQTMTPYQETGNHFISYFSPKEYGAFAQNWAVLQNHQGVMVFGNGDGVLKYDGLDWEFHSLPNLGVIRSLAMDDEGRVYIGAYDEIGYVTTDSLGNYRYQSLLEYLPDSLRNFKNVYKTHTLAGEVIFLTEKGLYRWHNHQFQFTLWQSELDRYRSFLIDNILYIQSGHDGLFKLKENQLEKVPGSEFFQEKYIREILPYDENFNLIITARNGLFLYNEDQVVPFPTSADPFLSENIIYCGIQLPTGDYAIGTLQKGVVIINHNGGIKNVFNKSTGLGDNSVYNFGLDNQGALWVVLSNGISRIEIQTPVTNFMTGLGLDGSINDIIRYQGKIYVSTTRGLFYLDQADYPERPAEFVNHEAFNFGVWELEVDQDILLINSNNGSFFMENDQLHQLNEFTPYSMVRSKINPNIVFIGLTDGVSILQKENGIWQGAPMMEGINAEVAGIHETYNGDIWIATFSEGVIKLNFPDTKNGKNYLHPQVNHFGEENGLQIGYTRIFPIDDQLIFWVKRNEQPEITYRFDSEMDRFIEYPDLLSHLGLEGISGYPVYSEEKGKIWVMEDNQSANPGDRIIVDKDRKGQFIHETVSFARLRDYSFRVLLQEDSIAWWGGHDGLIRIALGPSQVQDSVKFSTLINEITISDDSILFSGSGKPLESINFPYRSNSMRFQYTATAYDLPKSNQFQYWLEGYDDDWSAWSLETNKSYTRIPEGHYTFHVRAKNIYNKISQPTVYQFSVLPPLHRHVIAYILYAGLLVLFVFGIVKWRSAQLEKDKKVLEGKVKERTTEILEKNQQLKQLTEELESQTEQLLELDRMKSNFFANISHEFRTPLTLLLSPLERQLLNGYDAVHSRYETELMYRNAKRLQILINQLLDLSKLESGKMILYLSHGDIIQWVRVVVSSFESLAESKNITFDFHLPDDGLDCYYDPDKLEIILNNLLSNAFKFTPEGGKVNFTMEIVGKDPSEQMIIEVKDNGRGISSEALPKIFDRFYQADLSSAREFEGSGIGLSLTKELALLMDGKVEVESKEGTGSIFRLTIPVISDPGQNHVLPEDLKDVGSIAETIEHQENESNKLLSGKKDERHGLPIILLVEDNRDLSHYLTSLLDKHYEVIQAFNGQEGLNLANEYIPDLILSDMMMPLMDGFEFCTIIRKQEATSHIPFVLLTARASIQNRLEGLELGADEYLTKPFNINELMIRIQNLLEQRRTLRQKFSKEIKIQPRDVAITSLDERFLQKALDIMEVKISDPTFSVVNFSREIGMSRKHLHRKMVALIDQSPSEFIRIFRLKRAAQLLEKKSGNVSEISYKVGFENLSYFTKCFKEQFGVLPNEFMHKTN